MANGLPAGTYTDTSSFAADGSDFRIIMPQFTDKAMELNRELFGLIRAIAAEHDASPAQISPAWIICKERYSL